MYSEELKILDRNTVRLMIDEMNGIDERKIRECRPALPAGATV